MSAQTAANGSPTQNSLAPPGKPVRTVPWFGAMQAYKRRYERLHPSVQMIGLQLWLPLLFVALFALCYVNAFHSPAPHDVQVGVVGQQAATQVNEAFDKAVPGGFEVSAVAPGAAAGDVRSAALVAVYDPTTAGGPTLTIASANGTSNTQVIEKVFQATAAATHTTLQVKDVAPLPASDSAGTTALYVSLVATIGGYMVGMFTAMMGGQLKRRVRFGILAVSFIPLSLLAAILIDPVVGALHGHFFELWMVLLATMAAVGLTVNGLGYYFNRFVTGVALVLFVFLNIPASGGAIAADLVPEPFHWLNHVVIGGGTVPLLRDIFYQAGPGAQVGLWRLAIYAAVGLLLTIPGPAYARWRHHRRALLGLPAGGMMAHAQHQLMTMAQAASKPAHEAEVSSDDASGTATEAEAVIDDSPDDDSSRVGARMADR